MLMMISGISSITARPIASPLSAMPGPELVWLTGYRPTATAEVWKAEGYGKNVWLGTAMTISVAT